MHLSFLQHLIHYKMEALNLRFFNNFFASQKLIFIFLCLNGVIININEIKKKTWDELRFTQLENL